MGPRRPRRTVVVVDVVRDGLLVGQGRVVGTDRVVDPGALAGEEEAVVARVVPREDLGLHRVLVELLVPLDHLGGLVRHDRRGLAVGVEHLGPVAPRDRPVGRVGVGAMADRDADRVALLLEHLAHLEELVPGLRRPLEPGLLEVRHVVGPGERHPEPRNRLPARLGLAALRRERIPAASLLAQLLDQVVHRDEEVLVEERVGARGPVHVVARLRLGLGRDLGRHLQMRHGVDAHRAVVGLAEGLRLLAELVVRGGDEVVPAEEGQLPLLGVRGRLAESEPGGHPGGGAGGGTEESTSRDAAGSGPVHEGPP